MPRAIPPEAADIYVMNADGRGHAVTDSTYEDNDPECVAGRPRIVFKSTRDTKVSAREEIYVMNSEDQSQEADPDRRLAVGPRSQLEPRSDRIASSASKAAGPGLTPLISPRTGRS